MSKELSLRPYPGKIILCKSLKEMRRIYEKHTKEKYPYKDEKAGGRFIKIAYGLEKDSIWLVYGKEPHVLAHELTHVLLLLFERIGADPGCGNGEPFCYMLSQLMLDSE